jgi:hypothetical protein
MILAGGAASETREGASERVRNNYLVSKHRKGLPMGLILLIVLVLLLMGGLPTWGYSRNWGYGPSGGLGLVIVVVLVLLLMGYLPHSF